MLRATNKENIYFQEKETRDVKALKSPDPSVILGSGILERQALSGVCTPDLLSGHWTGATFDKTQGWIIQRCT